MNIWNVNFDVEKYMWCVFKVTEDIDLMKFSSLVRHDKILPETLPENIIFCNKDDENDNPIADMMMGSGAYAGIISDKAKKMLESEYKDLFLFYPVCLENFPEEKYYILHPTEFVYAEDVLDMKNTYIDYVRNDRKTCILYKVRRYTFTNKIKGHHFFRIIFNHGKNKIFNWKYCDDEFKEFIEKNNITGLKFTKIFEFKD